MQEAHLSALENRYAVPPEKARELAAQNLLASLDRVEAARLLNLLPDKLESGGILIRYPNAPETFTVRLDVPLRAADGKERKYLRPAGQGNRLYVPPGIDLVRTQEMWLTEGEMKALSVTLHGQPCVAVAGVWNWRQDVTDTDPLAAALELEGEKAPDRLAIIPDFQREWVAGRGFVLWYDSDIRPGHKAYPAFPRLAEQLYRMGAASVKILSVPPVKADGKTGLDDYLLEREKAGKDPLAELRALAAEAEEYLPTTGDGARAFAETVAADRSAPLARCVRAVAAILLAEGEAAAELAAEEIDRRRARALLKDAKRLVKARKEEEKRAAEARAKHKLERLLAEARQASELEKLREAVQAIRAQEKKKAAEIQEEIFGLTLAAFSALGKFYADDLGRTYWFSGHEKVLYKMDSAEWNRKLTNCTGLTDAETLGSALRKLLDAYAAENGERAAIRRISYFYRDNITLYLHQYDGRVLRLDGNRIEQVDNGTDGVLFLAQPEWVPWDYLDLSDPVRRAEAARLFQRFVLNANYDPTSPLPPVEACTVVLTWRLNGFFREISPTRAILLLLGETESGKSSLARFWLRLIYGGRADVDSQPEDVEKFRNLVTNEPWAVVDNVDSLLEWLPDELARVATGSLVSKRKLYTTNEREKYTIDTWLTLTARTPRFKRDDIATRLLPIRLACLNKKEPESRFLGELADPEVRNLVMSYLVLLLNQVVAAFRVYGIPDTDEDFRIADYAAFLRTFLLSTTGGDKAAADARTDAIITHLQQLQAEFLAEGNPLLDLIVEALDVGAVLEGQKFKAQELFASLAGFARAKDYEMPVRNPARLARKLIEMATAARVRGLQVAVSTDSKTKTSVFVFKRLQVS